MKISATDEYFNHKAIGGCSYMDDCERLYCRFHRTLYRFCETAVNTRDGAGQPYYEGRECPSCMREEIVQKWDFLTRKTA